MNLEHVNKTIYKNAATYDVSMCEDAVIKRTRT